MAAAYTRADSQDVETPALSGPPRTDSPSRSLSAYWRPAKPTKAAHRDVRSGELHVPSQGPRQRRAQRRLLARRAEPLQDGKP